MAVAGGRGCSSEPRCQNVHRFGREVFERCVQADHSGGLVKALKGRVLGSPPMPQRAPGLLNERRRGPWSTLTIQAPLNLRLADDRPGPEGVELRFFLAPGIIETVETAFGLAAPKAAPRPATSRSACHSFYLDKPTSLPLSRGPSIVGERHNGCDIIMQQCNQETLPLVKRKILTMGGIRRKWDLYFPFQRPTEYGDEVL